MIQNFKEDLTTDIVWIVAYDTEFALRINDIQIQLQKVALNEVQLGVPLFEVRHTLPINFDSGSL